MNNGMFFTFSYIFRAEHFELGEGLNKSIMGTAPDQSILDALRGYAIESSKNPKPRLVKIYISSTKHGK